MRRIFKAIGRALRRAFRAMRRSAQSVGAFGVGLVDGLFSGPAVMEEDDGPLDDYVEDHEAEAALETPRPLPSVCIASLIKRACEYRAAGRPAAPLFDISDARQTEALAYVVEIDEVHRRLLANAPVASIARHIDKSDPYRLGRLPIYEALPVNATTPATATAPANENSRISMMEAEDALDLMGDEPQTFRFG
ncbi:hypothetical protein [Aureimonas mangrovi]|uniref:hypothetical protein n=1 Tax=Aureimonas mangrovi TaxID=2758041 RepID=UPI00163D4A7B|nr:hypothetical protein [Aureimonas mangrovi]